MVIHSICPPKTGPFELDFTTPVMIPLAKTAPGPTRILRPLQRLPVTMKRVVAKATVQSITRVPPGRAARSLPVPCVAAGCRETEGWFFRAEFFLFRGAIPRRSCDYGWRAPSRLFVLVDGQVSFASSNNVVPGKASILWTEPETLIPPPPARIAANTRLIHKACNAQVITATHSPLLMAFPHARLLEISRFGIAETSLTENVSL